MPYTGNYAARRAPLFLTKRGSMATKLYKSLLEESEKELGTAKRMIAEDPKYTVAAIRHLFLSVKKSLDAFVAFAGESGDPTDDIELLLDLCGENDGQCYELFNDIITMKTYISNVNQKADEIDTASEELLGSLEIADKVLKFISEKTATIQ